MNLLKTKLQFLSALCVAGMLIPAAHASVTTFVTPGGSSTSGGDVDASAIFTTSAGEVTIVLTNLEVNITDVAQALSDLDFVLSNGATTGTLGTGPTISTVTVASGGAYTTGTASSTGWGVNDSVGGGIQLDVLGYAGPSMLIIGPPGSGGYTNANGSVGGNGPHNPFIDQTATFVVDVTGVTSATTVKSAVFSFGTTAGIDVDGMTGTPPVPEPTSIILLGTALAIVGKVMKSRLSA